MQHLTNINVDFTSLSLHRVMKKQQGWNASCIESSLLSQEKSLHARFDCSTSQAFLLNHIADVIRVYLGCRNSPHSMPWQPFSLWSQSWAPTWTGASLSLLRTPCSWEDVTWEACLKPAGLHGTGKKNYLTRASQGHGIKRCRNLSRSTALSSHLQPPGIWMWSTDIRSWAFQINNLENKYTDRGFCCFLLCFWFFFNQDTNFP